jgi:hypothetical protein
LKRRGSNRKGLSSEAQSWLRGERCGFFEYTNDDELEAVWNEYGDANSMFWRRDMSLPISLERLESFEDEWLASGINDDYGSRSFFVYKYYSDDEKQTLWSERGNETIYRWAAGMRRPELKQ